VYLSFYFGFLVVIAKLQNDSNEQATNEP
jgi:hypothetical protein